MSDVSPSLRNLIDDFEVRIVGLEEINVGWQSEILMNSLEHQAGHFLHGRFNVSANPFRPWWRHFPRYWPFVWGIHRSRWNPCTKASDAELWCFLWINDWVNNDEAGDVRRHRGHHDVNVMVNSMITVWCYFHLLLSISIHATAILVSEEVEHSIREHVHVLLCLLWLHHNSLWVHMQNLMQDLSCIIQIHRVTTSSMVLITMAS